MPKTRPPELIVNLSSSPWQVVGPITYTEPASSTRFYFEPTLQRVNGYVDSLLASTDRGTGNKKRLPQTYIGYTVGQAGDVSASNAFASWINAFSPEAVPRYTLNYQMKAFNGRASTSDFGEYFDTQSTSSGPATFYAAVVNMSGSTALMTDITRQDAEVVFGMASGGAIAGTQYDFGIADGGNVLNAGLQLVGGGTVPSGTIVSSGGVQYVASGGVTCATF